MKKKQTIANLMRPPKIQIELIAPSYRTFFSSFVNDKII